MAIDATYVGVFRMIGWWSINFSPCHPELTDYLVETLTKQFLVFLILPSGGYLICFMTIRYVA